jgi:glycosyltransferase involved in cell wall biosynthesis
MRAFRKTRILYVNHTGLVSGAEKVLLNLLRGIDRDRYEPIVVSPTQGDLCAEVFALGVEWFPIPAIDARFATRPDRLLRTLAPLVKTVTAIRTRIRELSPDIVHANSVRAGIASTIAAIGTGKPVIWHVHDTLPQHPASMAIRGFVRLARNTQVIAVSNATAKAFCGSARVEKKVRTVYNGVDLERFRSQNPESQRFRTKLGLSQDDFLVCAVGQICSRKGLHGLIDAFQLIHEQSPQLHLAIVGKVVFRHEEEYLKALQDKAQASGGSDRIHFVGEMHDVSSAMQAANLLVLNSWDEPFGLVLVEAMASGTPVLATRVGGIPEIVTDAETGWLIERGDTDGLALKLFELSRNRDALVCAALRAQHTTCPRFSLERFQSEMARYYSELAGSTDQEWNGGVQPALIRSSNS